MPIFSVPRVLTMPEALISAPVVRWVGRQSFDASVAMRLVSLFRQERYSRLYHFTVQSSISLSIKFFVAQVFFAHTSLREAPPPLTDKIRKLVFDGFPNATCVMFL